MLFPFIFFYHGIASYLKNNYLCKRKPKTYSYMYNSIIPQNLIDQAQNFYGIKLLLEDAILYLESGNAASPGAFIEWIHKQNKPSFI